VSTSAENALASRLRLAGKFLSTIGPQPQINLLIILRAAHGENQSLVISACYGGVAQRRVGALAVC
jgi:hypothetical protein